MSQSPRPLHKLAPKKQQYYTVIFIRHELRAEPVGTHESSPPMYVDVVSPM
jgi:hypothetical protein